MIDLESVTFNHTPGNAATSALNVRINGATTTPIPEYVHGASPVSHGVAYAMDATVAAALFVRVRFVRQATAPDLIVVRARGGGVLGRVGTVWVQFKANETSAVVDIPLTGRNFTAVGKYDVAWNWSYQSGVSWQPFAVSRHRIFLVLSAPSAPWTQVPGDARNPWTDLLAYSCAMAGGTSSQLDALRALAKRLYTDFSLRYDITGANQKYGIGDTRIPGQDKFRLADWID